MCKRHHTHCSVESVMERGVPTPSLSLVCGRDRRVVETWTTHMSVQVIEERRPHLRWSDTCCNETPTTQYIIYNIKRTVWNSCHPAQTSQQHVTWSSSSHPPTPPRKKPSDHNLPETSPYQISGIDPMDRPFKKDSHPEPASDRGLTQSRTRISIPLVITREQRPWRVPPRKWLNVIRGSRSPHLESHPTKRESVTLPKQTQPRRVPTQWVRTSTP